MIGRYICGRCLIKPIYMGRVKITAPDYVNFSTLHHLFYW